ncbi:MAG TPA: hypothetical protein VL994_11255 [Steroidobacteraceae bacterium]|nr:hypothetical protein [Steroidobacteraceae bacterium]
MRLFSGAFAVIGMGLVSIALADTPPAAPTASTPSSTAAAPAPSATPAASTTAAASDEPTQLERHFISEGYRLKMHGGQKLYCRKEAQIGSRLASTESCGTVDQLKSMEDQTQAQVRHAQQTSQRPGT